MKAYRFTPLDILFFRETITLPSIETIIGSIRTTVIMNNGYSIEKYKEISKHHKEGSQLEEKDIELINKIGLFGEKAPFNVLGLFLEKEDKIFAQAPVTVFGNDVIATNSIFPSSLNSLGIQSSFEIKSFKSPKSKIDHESLFGRWYDIERKNYSGSIEDSEFFGLELRTGNALDVDTRTVRDGYLYESLNVRYKEGVSIIVVLSDDILEGYSGFMNLGGDTHKVYCETLQREKEEIIKTLYQEEAKLYVSTVPIIATDENEKHLIGSKKLLRIGGFDLSKHFYKESLEYYPAGSVFDTNIMGQCLSLKEGK